MFVKPFRTKSAVTVRNSDRRKLKSRLATFFPGTPEESLAHMVPAKGDFKETKVITHKGEPVSVFTAYGLWKDSFLPFMGPNFLNKILNSFCTLHKTHTLSLTHNG